MMKKQLIIQKIHLEGFMDLLMELYMDGAVFFDIASSVNDEQDIIKVVVKEEYFEEYQEPPPSAPLTMEFLNSLI
jgi:hypothetical protein